MALAATSIATTAAGGLRSTFAAVVRADAALTTSYVASDHMDVTGADACTVLIAYTYASATSIEWYVEWSHDGTTWFRSINVSPAAGVNTITANSQTYATSATINLSDGNIPVEAAYVRVQIKRTGGAAGDTAAVTVEGLVRGR
jgi:hypothetical protein